MPNTIETATLYTGEITTDHLVVAIYPAGPESKTKIEFGGEARVLEASVVGTDFILVLQPEGTVYEDQSIEFTLPLSAQVKITL